MIQLSRVSFFIPPTFLRVLHLNIWDLACLSKLHAVIIWQHAIRNVIIQPPFYERKTWSLLILPTWRRGFYFLYFSRIIFLVIADEGEEAQVVSFFFFFTAAQCRSLFTSSPFFQTFTMQCISSLLNFSLTGKRPSARKLFSECAHRVRSVFMFFAHLTAGWKRLQFYSHLTGTDLYNVVACEIAFWERHRYDWLVHWSMYRLRVSFFFIRLECINECECLCADRRTERTRIHQRGERRNELLALILRFIELERLYTLPCPSRKRVERRSTLDSLDEKRRINNISLWCNKRKN